MGTIDLHVAQHVEDIPLLKHLPGAGDRRIRITYTITEEESAAEGDYEETGWENEAGVLVEPDEYDIEEGRTAVDNAVRFLKNSNVSEPSSSQFHPGVWYTAYDEPMEIGGLRDRSFHLSGFTEEEELEIFNRMVGG